MLPQLEWLELQKLVPHSKVVEDDLRPEFTNCLEHRLRLQFSERDDVTGKLLEPRVRDRLVVSVEGEASKHCREEELMVFWPAHNGLEHVQAHDPQLRCRACIPQLAPEEDVGPAGVAHIRGAVRAHNALLGASFSSQQCCSSAKNDSVQRPMVSVGQHKRQQVGGEHADIQRHEDHMPKTIRRQRRVEGAKGSPCSLLSLDASLSLWEESVEAMKVWSQVSSFAKHTPLQQLSSECSSHQRVGALPVEVADGLGLVVIHRDIDGLHLALQQKILVRDLSRDVVRIAIDHRASADVIDVRGSGQVHWRPVQRR